VEALGEASSHDLNKRALTLSGEQSQRSNAIEELLNCRLLIDVLKGLGGVSQEDQQPALFCLSGTDVLRKDKSEPGAVATGQGLNTPKSSGFPSSDAFYVKVDSLAGRYSSRF